MIRRLLIGNWKMNHGPTQTVAWLEEASRLAWPDAVELAVAPPFVSLAAAQAARASAANVSFGLAAQTCHAATHGAFTGEVAAPMLAELGVRYVLVGHSERRQLFGETDDVVKAKVAAVLAAGLVPVVCVGETLAERDASQTFAVVQRQLEIALAGLSQGTELVIAYEPVWAIGTGRNATPAQAQEVHAHIRGLLAAAWPANATTTPILYGGSVKPANTAALMGGPDINGALVGGASLAAAEFAAIAGAMV